MCASEPIRPRWTHRVSEFRISPLRTQARRRFTQVIHMDVHSQPAKFTRMNRAGRYPTHRSLPQRLTARWSLTSALTDDARTTSRAARIPAPTSAARRNSR